MTIHPSHEAQIAWLGVEEAPVAVRSEYLDLVNVFSEDSVAELLEHTGIDGRAIDLEKGKQPPYRPYSQPRAGGTRNHEDLHRHQPSQWFNQASQASWRGPDPVCSEG